MAKFPIREAEVIALADEMIAGYQGHGADFPSSDVSTLMNARTAYTVAKDNQVAAQAQAAVATEDKDLKANTLQEVMRHELRKSETDTVADPEKLRYIGWGPKSQPTPSDPPGQPRGFESVRQGHGNLVLDWKRPARGTGGQVRSYIVERREQDNTGMTEWHAVGTSLETELRLEGQPRAISMEYRVIAVNVGGESKPSNTIDVVL